MFELQTIYKSPLLDVFSSQLGQHKNTLITFSNWTKVAPKPLWADFVPETSAGIFFVAKRNHWYQIEEMPKVIMAVNSILPIGGQVVTAGSSMGGFAALAFGTNLGAKRSFAISPQFSPSQEIIPDETRWQGDKEWFSPWRYSIPKKLENAHIVFDPENHQDRAQVDAISQNSRGAELVPLPFSGHPSGFSLQDLGLIRESIRLLLSDRFEINFSDLISGYHKASWKSATYLLNRSKSIPNDPLVKAFALTDVVRGHPATISKLRSHLGDPSE